MGSRAVVVVCRDARRPRASASASTTGAAGSVYTRTGRRFFDDRALEQALLARVRDAATGAGLWDELQTDWLCLDCELMPWSAKAQEPAAQAVRRGRRRRPGVAAAGRRRARAGRRPRRRPSTVVGQAFGERRSGEIERYVDAYRRYCWPVDSLDDLKLAPFHLLASEGAVHIDRDHAWHLELAARLCAGRHRPAHPDPARHRRPGRRGQRSRRHRLVAS